MDSDNDDNLYTKQGFPKTQLLGDDLNRRGLLAKRITDLLPGYHEHYNLINEQLAKITYGRYSFFLHLCYSRKLKELEENLKWVLEYK